MAEQKHNIDDFEEKPEPKLKYKNYKRNKLQKEEDTLLAMEMHSRGYSYEQITKKINSIREKDGYTLSRIMIYKDIKKERDKITKMVADNQENYIAFQLQKINQLKTEAWEAWEKSKEVKIKKEQRVKKRGGNQKDNQNQDVEQKQTQEEQVGNAKFLTLIKDLIQMENKMLGLDREEVINKIFLNNTENHNNQVFVVKSENEVPEQAMIMLPDNNRSNEDQ